MDYVTRQFIVLAKKLREDLRLALTALQRDVSRLIHISEEQAEAANKRQQTDAENNNNPPTLP